MPVDLAPVTNQSPIPPDALENNHRYYTLPFYFSTPDRGGALCTVSFRNSHSDTLFSLLARFPDGAARPKLEEFVSQIPSEDLRDIEEAWLFDHLTERGSVSEYFHQGLTRLNNHDYLLVSRKFYPEEYDLAKLFQECAPFEANSIARRSMHPPFLDPANIKLEVFLLNVANLNHSRTLREGMNHLQGRVSESIAEAIENRVFGFSTPHAVRMLQSGPDFFIAYAQGVPAKQLLAFRGQVSAVLGEDVRRYLESLELKDEQRREAQRLFP